MPSATLNFTLWGRGGARALVLLGSVIAPPKPARGRASLAALSRARGLGPRPPYARRRPVGTFSKTHSRFCLHAPAPRFEIAQTLVPTHPPLASRLRIACHLAKPRHVSRQCNSPPTARLPNPSAKRRNNQPAARRRRCNTRKPPPPARAGHRIRLHAPRRGVAARARALPRLPYGMRSFSSVSSLAQKFTYSCDGSRTPETPLKRSRSVIPLCDGFACARWQARPLIGPQSLQGARVCKAWSHETACAARLARRVCRRAPCTACHFFYNSRHHRPGAGCQNS